MSADKVRAMVAARAGNRCEYCQLPANYSLSSFHAEHVLPKATGGSDELENLAWACAGCNGHKSVATQARDPKLIARRIRAETRSICGHEMRERVSLETFE